MAPKIKVSSATFAFMDKPVWKDLNFEVTEGETICILGANGCGKTTLLNCLHGDLKLAAGTIELDGKDIRTLKNSEIARRVGYVFQEHAAPFPYEVIDVVTMGRTPHLGLFQSPSSADVEIARNTLRLMGIEHLSGQRYTQISGGERQLVLIARTLCQEPDVILLDEPTSHLDFGNQAMVLKTIQRLSNQGLTIIMTTHFPNHAWLFSNRVALMRDGGLIGFGGADETITAESLSQTYGIKVKLYSIKDGSENVRFCVPDF